MKLPTTIFLIILSFSLTGQSRYSMSLQLKGGFSGFEKKENSSIEWTTTSKYTKPGINFSVGINNNFFLTKKRWFSLSAGLFYNYVSFTRELNVETLIWPNTLGEKTISKDTRKFSSESFQLPIELHIHLRKFRFSGGVIPSYRRNALYQLSQTQYILGNSGEKINFAKAYYPEVKLGENEFLFGQEVRPFLDKQIDLEYTFGFDYLITESIRLGIAYSDFFASNTLMLRYIGPDKSMRPILPLRYSGFEFASKTITLALNWEI